jgi:DNA repair exonuclease SbcCD ATPase subunit
MSSDRVSDERLEELIAETGQTAKTWKDFDADQVAKNPEYESFVQDKCDNLLSALLELQSRRAAEQAALPAVEEMAEKLTRFVEAKISAYLPGDITLPDDEARAIRELLTPLYARIADLEQQLSRNQQFVADLQKAIAERDAVLGECRPHVESWSVSSARPQLLNRIDALLERN